MNTQIFIERLNSDHRQYFPLRPNKISAESWINQLFFFLFSPKPHDLHSAQHLHEEYRILQQQCCDLLSAIDAEHAERISQEFFSVLLPLYEILLQDAQDILACDPAAHSLAEILLFYPGFYATALYRFAHFFYQAEVKLLPRLFSEYAHSKTGIDIHPGATIGFPFFIDHGTGIVIGETSVIGRHVKIYQGVTLGALTVHKKEASCKRHPTISDHVTVYAGATVLGGNTCIGHHSIIGSGVWLNASIPAYSVVNCKKNVIIRQKNHDITD